MLALVVGEWRMRDGTLSNVSHHKGPRTAERTIIIDEGNFIITHEPVAS